jgi:hypothetical protein
MEKWTYADNYIGKDYSSYYIIYGHHRDSDIFQESNYQSIKAYLEDNNVPYIDCSFNHWLVGWIEQLLIHENDYIDENKDHIDHIEKSLLDYPIFDDDDYQMREDNEIIESWDNWIEYDFTNMLLSSLEPYYFEQGKYYYATFKNVPISEHDYDNMVHIMDNDDNALHTLFDELCNKYNMYVEIEGNGTYFNMDRLQEIITFDDIEVILNHD